MTFRSLPLSAKVGSCQERAEYALFQTIIGEPKSLVLSVLSQSLEDPDARHEEMHRRSYMHFAAARPRSLGGAASIAERLRELGVCADAEDALGQTPLFFAAREGNSQCVGTLIESRCHVNHCDRYGQTAIFYASSEGRLSTVQELVQLGAVAYLADKKRQTSLFYAARNGHADLVRPLLSYKCSINHSDACGQSPLFYAARYNHIDFIKTLIELGASLTIVDSYGKTVAGYHPMKQAVNKALGRKPQKPQVLLGERSTKITMQQQDSQIEGVKQNVDIPPPNLNAEISPDIAEINLKRFCGPQTDIGCELDENIDTLFATGIDLSASVNGINRNLLEITLSYLRTLRDDQSSHVSMEAARGKLRIINLPDGSIAQARRKIMQRDCIDVLQTRFPSLDVRFSCGVRSKELDWIPALSKGKEALCRCGGNFRQRRLRPSTGPLACQTCHWSDASSVYYECVGCAVVACPACAGHGRATTVWNGRTFAQDSEFWDLDGCKEHKRMYNRFCNLGFHPNKVNWDRFSMDCAVPMTPGFIGCQIAHWRCWCEADYPEWLLVLEDDAVPIPVLEMDWGDVVALLCNEIAELRADGEEWDMLWVGRCKSMSLEEELPEHSCGHLPSLLVKPGYVVGMHCYCLSRRGLQRLLGSEFPCAVLRPIDEMIGTLNIAGQHPRQGLETKIKELGGCLDFKEWRSLAFPYMGLAVQMCDLQCYQGYTCASSQDALEQYLNPSRSGAT